MDQFRIFTQFHPDDEWFVRVLKARAVPEIIDEDKGPETVFDLLWEGWLEGGESEAGNMAVIALRKAVLS